MQKPQIQFSIRVAGKKGQKDTYTDVDPMTANEETLKQVNFGRVLINLAKGEDKEPAIAHAKALAMAQASNLNWDKVINDSVTEFRDGRKQVVCTFALERTVNPTRLSPEQADVATSRILALQGR